MNWNVCTTIRLCFATWSQPYLFSPDIDCSAVVERLTLQRHVQHQVIVRTIFFSKISFELGVHSLFAPAGVFAVMLPMKQPLLMALMNWENILKIFYCKLKILCEFIVNISVEHKILMNVNMVRESELRNNKLRKHKTSENNNKHRVCKVHSYHFQGITFRFSPSHENISKERK